MGHRDARRQNSKERAGPGWGRDDMGETAQAEIVARLELVNEQLRGALDSRIVIEQAKGILSERFALRMDDAFELLRYAARRSRMELSALSRAVVSSLPEQGSPSHLRSSVP